MPLLDVCGNGLCFNGEKMMRLVYALMCIRSRRQLHLIFHKFSTQLWPLILSKCELLKIFCGGLCDMPEAP